MTVVLAAIDQTPAARPVLATAVAIAHVLGAVPRAVHARGDGLRVPEQDAAAFGVPLTVVDEPPVTAIVKAANDPEVALVVLALRGQPDRDAAGGTALAVMAQLTRPVLFVPPEEPVRDNLKRVLFPLDGTQGASRAVRSMISSFRDGGAEVIILHVFDARTVPRFLDRAQDLEIWADEFLARHCTQPGVRLELRSGDPTNAILHLAEAENVDVVALGWRQDLSADRAQVARTILTEAKRPVALVPLPDVRQWSDPER
jgi:nucleotide-binding universal stress UspA family protein